jgi:Fic family protein
MYFHERNNWYDFKWDASRLLFQLTELRHLQGRLLGQMESLGFELGEKATFENLISEVIETSKIEGEFLNPESVRSSIANKLGIAGAEFVSVPRNVEGIVDVLLDATQNYAKPFSEERLLGWHNALFQSGYSGYLKIDVAKYRSVGMKVVSGVLGKEKVHFEAPSPERVKHEMDVFLSWIESKNEIDSVLKAAIAHLWFITIHPFDDGNGRLARAIMDMLLARSENSKIRFYSVSNQIYKEHKQYNLILEKTQKGTGEITDYLLWFIECLKRAMLASESNLEIILDKARFWDKFRFTSINERQRIVINYVYDNYSNEIGFLRSSVYAKLVKCSTDTALRDLQDLVGKEMLISEDSGKKTNYIIASPGKFRIPNISSRIT